jgi:ribosome maturation factor RimP
MLVLDQIKPFVDQTITETGFMIVDLKVGGSRIMQKITILLDTETGISIDECAEFSRSLDQKIEESGITDIAYTLEVSSPGVEVSLKYPLQYPKHIGRILALSLADGTDFLGKLTAANAEHIELIEEKKRKKSEIAEARSISFVDITKALVQVSFK